MTAARQLIVAVGAALSLTAVACSDAPLDLGPDPDVVWWSDHETGDLSDWLRGGTAFGETYLSNGDVAVTTDRARSGTHALRSMVGAPAANGLAAAQVFRSGFHTGAAYYGAWFSVPTVAQPATYWVFFSFHERTPSATDNPLWDLKLATIGAGLELQLFHHDTGDVVPIAHVPVPLDRWFQVEAFFVPAPDARGRLQIWLDGTPVFDVSGTPTWPGDAATVPVSWTVGTITNGLAPAPPTLYVDDAYVSRRRLGPGFPPFWRAP